MIDTESAFGCETQIHDPSKATLFGLPPSGIVAETEPVRLIFVNAGRPLTRDVDLGKRRSGGQQHGQRHQSAAQRTSGHTRPPGVVTVANSTPLLVLMPTFYYRLDRST